MFDYTEYERAFDWNIADLNFNKITIGEYERKFRQIVDKIRADAIDEMLNFINVRMSHLVDLAEEDCRKANTYQEYYHRGGLWELGIVRDEVVKLKEQNNDK